jgi:hypothetical protein
MASIKAKERPSEDEGEVCAFQVIYHILVKPANRFAVPIEYGFHGLNTSD